MPNAIWPLTFTIHINYQREVNLSWDDSQTDTTYLCAALDGCSVLLNQLLSPLLLQNFLALLLLLSAVEVSQYSLGSRLVGWVCVSVTCGDVWRVCECNMWGCVTCVCECNMWGCVTCVCVCDMWGCDMWGCVTCVCVWCVNVICYASFTIQINVA